MTRLIHLNGPPGVGKSTIARRYVSEHPGVLNCDIDTLRTLIGGWESDFAEAGALIRPAALAMIGAYLASGHDVILPQMLVRMEELEKFEQTVIRAGAEFVEVVLMEAREAAVARFHRRGRGQQDPWHQQVSRIVDANGGSAALEAHHDSLTALLTNRPNAHEIASVEGAEDATYRSLLELLDDLEI